MILKFKPSYRIPALIVLALIIGLVIGSFFNGSNTPLEKQAVASLENKPSKAITKKTLKSFNFWQLECDQGKSNCNIFQRLTFQKKEKGGNAQTILALNLIIYLTQSEDGEKIPRIRFVTPLGLDLTSGLAMRIDKGKEFKMPIQICNVTGCIADYNLGEDVLLEMKKGANVLVGYRLSNAKPVILKASLKGISAAYKELQSK